MSRENDTAANGVTRWEDADVPSTGAEVMPPLPPASDETRELVGEVKIREILGLLGLPFDMTEPMREAHLRRAIDLYASLQPADGLEGMIAAQMVGTHLAGLKALELAAAPDELPAARDMYLNQAMRLMNMHLKQLAALDKRRGRGQQKVTVEHVNVAAGGAAIVGTVHTDGSRRPAQSPSEPPVRMRQRITPHGTPE